MRVTLVDSPLANIANITRALERAGATVDVTGDAATIARARDIVLPGVGSFKAGMTWLNASGVGGALLSAVASGARLLGVCLGHQLLFESSDEMGEMRGLGLIQGSIRRFEVPLPVPQIGWNVVESDNDPLFDGIPERTAFYFVHSYHAVCGRTQVIATSSYGGEFTAAVRHGNVAGVQFHPERSSTAGLRLLSNFVAGANR